MQFAVMLERSTILKEQIYFRAKTAIITFGAPVIRFGFKVLVGVKNLLYL
jgi:hypothetical protein